MKINYSNNQEACFKYIFFKVALVFKFLTLAFEALQNLAPRELYAVLSVVSGSLPASSQSGPCVTSVYRQNFPKAMSLIKLFLWMESHPHLGPRWHPSSEKPLLLLRWALSLFERPWYCSVPLLLACLFSILCFSYFYVFPISIINWKLSTKY